MKRTFKLDGLCCPNCAQKMEDGINKLDGVEAAKIAFMTERLSITSDTDDWDSLLDAAQKVCEKYEDDCTIVRR